MSVGSLSVTTLLHSRKTYAQDGSSPTNNFISTYECRVNPLTGIEQIKYAKETTLITHKVYIAGSPDIRNGDTLFNESITLLVRAVRNIDLIGKFLTIECEEQL